MSVRPASIEWANMNGVTAVVGHPPVPAWQSLWAQINRRFNRLRRVYSGALKLENTGDLEDDVDALLLCLWNLHDWLLADGDIGKSLSEEVKLVGTRDPLDLCHDHADSFKHHTYSRKRVRHYARLHETTVGPDGVSCSLQYWKTDTSVDTESMDALEFATECIKAWRAFFATHGITDPEPPAE
jgi:hypothetical protein